MEVDLLSFAEYNALLNGDGAVKAYASYVAFNTCLSGICLLKLGANGPVFTVKSHLTRREAHTVVLIHAAKGRKIVIAGLHKPELISIRGEGLLGIFAYTRVNYYGLSVIIHHKVSAVIVVVHLAVVAGLCRNKHTDLAVFGLARSHNAKIRKLGISRHRAVFFLDIGRVKPFERTIHM